MCHLVLLLMLPTQKYAFAIVLGKDMCIYYYSSVYPTSFLPLDLLWKWAAQSSPDVLFSRNLHQLLLGYLTAFRGILGDPYSLSWFCPRVSSQLVVPNISAKGSTCAASLWGSQTSIGFSHLRETTPELWSPPSSLRSSPCQIESAQPLWEEA